MKNLQPHPIAERYPLLDGEEFETFKASIRDNGPRVKIVLFEGKILDGRNRYRACSELGIEPLTETFTGTEREAEVLADVLNFDRRHLTREQKRAVIAFKLKANPEQSDRSIAEEVKVDHKTVAAVRRSTASTGEFPQLSARRKGRDGRRRTATPKRRAAPPPSRTANEPKSSSDDTFRDQIAAILGLPPADINLAKAILDHGAPEVVKAVDAGKMSLQEAFMTLRAPLPDLGIGCAWEGGSVHSPFVVELIPSSLERGFMHILLSAFGDDEGDGGGFEFASQLAVPVGKVWRALNTFGVRAEDLEWRRVTTAPCADPPRRYRVADLADLPRRSVKAKKPARKAVRKSASPPIDGLA